MIQAIIIDRMTILYWLVLTHLISGLLCWAFSSSFGAGQAVNSADISPDNQYIVVGLENNDIEVYAMANQSRIQRITSYSYKVRSVRFSPDQQFIAASFEGHSKVGILSGNPPFNIITNVTSFWQIYQVDFSYDSSRLLACGWWNGIKVYSTATWNQLYSQNIWSKVINSCNFAPNGDIAVGEYSGNVRVYYANYSVRWTHKPGNKQHWGITFSADSNTVVVGDQDNNIRLYSPVSVSSPSSTFSDNQKVKAVAWSRDGAYWVSGGEGKKTNWYNGTTNYMSQKMFSFSQPTDTVNDIVFSRNNQYCIVGGKDKKVYIYEGTPMYLINSSAPVNTTPADNSTAIWTFPGCPLQHYQNSGTTCRLCALDMQGCRTCTNGTVCIGCSQHYYLHSSGLCLSCSSIDNVCVQCHQPGQCLQCMSGHYLSSSTNCAKCSDAIKGCLFCANSSSCISCFEGPYYLDNTTSICIPCTDLSNCFQCTSSSYCTVCQLDFYASNGSCSVCHSSCLTCVSGFSCLTCPYGSYISGGACLSCPQGCWHCSSSDCLICSPGYFLGNGACSSCVNGCTSCYNGSICLECQPGYYSINNSCVACSSHHSACQLCSQTECSWCSSGYFLTANSTQCQLCSTHMSDCLTCNSSNSCLSCQLGSYLDNSTCLECPCPSCIDVNTCIVCGEMQYLEGGSCLSCQSGCLSCQIYTHCDSCVTGWFLSGDDCLPCLPQCLSCNSSVTCLTCQQGWYQISSACQLCPSGCTTCLNSSLCQSCLTGYFLINGTCQECSLLHEGCSQCTASVCLGCLDRYFLNSSCQLCHNSLLYCLVCSSNSVCDSCFTGYYWDGTNCLPCSQSLTYCQSCSNSTQCLSCLTGYFSDSGSCMTCPDNCLQCYNSTTCLKCADYAYISSGTCDLCSISLTGCVQCQSSSSCSLCLSGFYLSNSSCNSCSSSISGCQLCLDQLTCLSCQPFKVLNSTSSICSECETLFANCLICNSSSCLECSMGHYLLNDSCHYCPTNCSECSSSSTCLACQGGYYLDTDHCQICSGTFQGCFQCNSTDCFSCLSGYSLNSSSAWVICQAVNCQVCGLNSTTQCTTCNSGYFLANSTCVSCSSSIANCAYCYSNVSCETCSRGFTLNASSCEPCSTLYPFCASCNQSQCLQCDSGYRLNSSSCVACDEQCINCLSNGDCITCKSGFFLNASVCASCTSLTGCLLCSSQHSCTRCALGYYLQNTICHKCNISVPFCSVCSSKTVCLACHQSYELQSNFCSLITVSDDQYSYSQLFFYSQYVDENTLRHTLIRKYGRFNISQYILQTTMSQFQLGYIDSPQPAQKFAVTSISFNDYNTAIIVWTSNPLSLITSPNYQSLPRVLTQSNLQVKGEFQLIVSPTAMAILEPQSRHHNQLTAYYSTQQPKFTQSLQQASHSSTNYHLFGISIVIYMVCFYLIKSVVLRPRPFQKGQLVSHILFLKMVALIIHPTYAQLQQYCEGFMVADLPWLNEQFHSLTGHHNYEEIPEPYQLYYTSLNIAATYPLPLLIFLTLLVLLAPLILRRLCCYESAYNFIQFCYDFWLGGITVASCACLVHALEQGMSELTILSLMYVLGIAVYLVVIAHVLGSMLRQHNYLYRLRIVIKGSLLSLAHYDPITIYALVLSAEIAFIILQLSSTTIIHPKLWAAAHTCVNLSLALLIYRPKSEVVLITSSSLVFLALLLEIIRACKDHSSRNKLSNSHQIQSQIQESRQDLTVQANEEMFKTDFMSNQNK